MKKTILIKSKEQLKVVWEYLQDLSFDDLHEVTIRPHKESLRSRQRRLYWKWLTLISSKTGNTKNDLHFQYKELYLVNIFIRDDRDYSEMVEAVKTVRRGGNNHTADILKREIVKLTSITKTNTKQMAEYSNDIYMHAQEFHNMNLPVPGDPDEDWD